MFHQVVHFQPPTVGANLIRAVHGYRIGLVIAIEEISRWISGYRLKDIHPAKKILVLCIVTIEIDQYPLVEKSLIAQFIGIGRFRLKGSELLLLQ